ncbi:MAG: hypothetical protein ABR926_18455 [Streptosporangiaceae bacterium]|jgi:hypothetical protein
MNVTTWDDDVSLRQTNEWLAALRDDRQAEPPGAGTRPARGAAPPGRPAVPAPAAIPGQRRALGQATDAPWASAPAPADAGPRVTSIPVPAGAAAPVTVRAAIGDELRRPIMWCEMASCINYHADPSALGEADARARAIRAGWRIDAVGRLACPQCQQTTSFWTPRPVVPWDRATALVMTTLAAVRAGWAGGRQQREQEQEQQAWHHEQPWGHAGRHSRATPARPYISPA